MKLLILIITKWHHNRCHTNKTITLYQSAEIAGGAVDSVKTFIKSPYLNRFRVSLFLTVLNDRIDENHKSLSWAMSRLNSWTQDHNTDHEGDACQFPTVARLAIIMALTQWSFHDFPNRPFFHLVGLNQIDQTVSQESPVTKKHCWSKKRG